MRAKYPGELEVRLERAQGYVVQVLRAHAAGWIVRLGYDEAYAEALYGAMRGIVAWLFRGGSVQAAIPKIQTFIFRGIIYHFGKGVSWHVGPIRIPHGSDRSRLVQYDLSDTALGTGAHPAFAVEDDRFRALDNTEEHLLLRRKLRSLLRRVKLDPTSRAVLYLRLGMRHRALSFSEIGARLGISRQAAHHRFRLAALAIQSASASSGSC